jgi:hypothetical protein
VWRDGAHGCPDGPSLRDDLKTLAKDIPDDSIAEAGWQLH